MLPHENAATSTSGESPNFVTCAFSKRTTLLLILIASILCPLAIYLFGRIAFQLHPRYTIPAIVIGPGQGKAVLLWVGGVILAITLLTFTLLALHEYCHGLAFRWAGAKPRYGAKMLHKIVPIFYAAAPGFRMPCRKFRTVLLAPTIAVNLIGILMMWPPTLLRYLMVFPLGIHLAGCLGDWWMLMVLRGTPGDTLVEDTPAGFRYEQNSRR